MTGSTGFLGKHIYDFFLKNDKCALHRLGRNNSAEYKIDLTDGHFTIDCKYNIVIHCAGKAHFVPKNTIESNLFLNVNHIGTLNLLSALSNNPPDTFVFISSVSVYGLDEGINIKETAPLLASDPYGKSKILAEQSVIEWALKHKVNYLILRLPLLVGKDAPGNLGAMINSIKKGYYFNINGGKAKRSMLLVEDVPKAIKHLLGNSGIFNITDGCDPSYREMSSLIGTQVGREIYSLPLFLCKLLAVVGDIMSIIPFNSYKLKKLNQSLTFDSNIIRSKYGFIPQKVIENFKIN